MDKLKKTVIIGVISLIILIIISALTLRIDTIAGGQIGVLETWSEGVVSEPLHPKTYIWVPGFNKKVYKYSVEQQVFVMNDDDSGGEYGEGRKGDSYSVPSTEGQNMKISLSVQWRRDPLKVVELHETARDNVEERILRPEIQRIVKDEATILTAIEAYSGAGLVKLQKSIENRLRDDNGELRKKGVIVDNFVIQKIDLEPMYLEQITARQVAVQARLRAIEETRAAEAAADRAKAEAQADYEKRIVEANRDKQVGILNSQKEAEQVILQAEAAARQVEIAAKAEMERNILIAKGNAEAGIQQAMAIEALGRAEAEATKLKMLAYSSEGADMFARIEIAKSMSDAFKGIKGYLPESMSINLLAESYNKGISLLVEPNRLVGSGN
jgi:regulator of protease activity HflC (stomatin/prohibitin superfamily)